MPYKKEVLECINSLEYSREGVMFFTKKEPIIPFISKWYNFNLQSNILYIKIPCGVVRLKDAVWYKELGHWPSHYLYHKDGNPNNCHISNLTRHNPLWGRVVKANIQDIHIHLFFKEGDWFIRKGNEVLGPYADMKDAQDAMYRITLEGS